MVSHHTAGARVLDRYDGHRVVMFLMFSNRLGCLGSLLVSAVATGVLIVVVTR